MLKINLNQYLRQKLIIAKVTPSIREKIHLILSYF